MGWRHEGVLNQSTYKIWKQSNKDVASYRENDEVSADADVTMTKPTIVSPPPPYVLRTGHTITKNNNSSVQTLFLFWIQICWIQRSYYVEIHRLIYHTNKSNVYIIVDIKSITTNISNKDFYVDIKTV